MNLILRGATIVKGCDILKRSVNDPAIQLLYWPISQRLRRLIISFTSGFIKPASEGVGSFLLYQLILFDASYSNHLMFLILGLTMIWVVLASSCYRISRMQDRHLDQLLDESVDVNHTLR